MSSKTGSRCRLKLSTSKIRIQVHCPRSDSKGIIVEEIDVGRLLMATDSGVCTSEPSGYEYSVVQDENKCFTQGPQNAIPSTLETLSEPHFHES